MVGDLSNIYINFKVLDKLSFLFSELFLWQRTSAEPV